MTPSSASEWTAPQPDADRQAAAVRLALRLAGAGSRAEVAQVSGEALQSLVGWKSLQICLSYPQSGKLLTVLSLPAASLPARTGSAAEAPGTPARIAPTRIDLSIPLERGAAVALLRMEREQAYSMTERALAGDIAQHCCGPMSRADAHERLVEAYRRIVVFGRLAHRLGLQTTPLEAGQLIADIAEELIGWDACYFDLYDTARDSITEMINIDTMGSGKRAVQGHHTGGPPGQLERRLLDSGGFILEQDVHAPSDYNSFGDESRPSASMLFVPARYRDEVVAFFSIQSYMAKAYTQEDLDLLQTLADHCGGALVRIRLEERIHASEDPQDR